MDLRKQLLWDLLSVPDNSSKSNYSSWFQKVSTLGPVFIAVDDVHKLGQFEELIPFTSGLHPESRIVVTSRDRGVLNTVAGRAKLNRHVFDVCPLDWNEANVLFNWHAFQAKEAVKGYESVAKDVVRACSGVPLALKVVGSSLFDKQLDGDEETIWREAVIELRKNRDVMGVLRWSYDSLPESEKHMFLDIACLFHGWSREEAFAYWGSCKDCMSCGGVPAPHTSLRNLINKNLVMPIQDLHISGGLKVHDLLKELGQEIGMKTKRHFINGKDAEAIVSKNHGSENTMGLNLEGSRIQVFEVENFTSMPNLHYLQLPRGCKINGDLKSISRDIRLLHWQAMPYTSVPAGLNLCHLIELDFSESTSLAELWTKSNKSLENCSNLRVLNLNYCTSITRLPDSMGQSIQDLWLEGCEKLEMLPPSIQHLTGLTSLDLSNCESLKALPDSIGALSNLEYLRALDCTSLQALPTSIGLLSSLQTLNIGANPGCQISSEDIGIGSAWTKLWRLDLRNCGGLGSRLDYDAMTSLHELVLKDSALTKLPESMGKLTRLSNLSIQCERLQCLPESMGKLTQLSNLSIQCERLQCLLESMGKLTQLSFLYIECERLQCLPNSIGDLKMLRILVLDQCHNLTRLPKSLGAISSLNDLHVTDCAIRKLPKSIGLLSKLRDFRIRDCKNLHKLPSSIRFPLKSLRCFEFVDCGSREAMGASSTGLQDLLECGALEKLSIQDNTFTELMESLGQSVPLDQLTVGCERVQCLPNSFGYLKELRTLELSGCLHLTRLPKNLGAITSLRWLTIRCCLIRKLPRSIGLLSQLLELEIIGCKNLEKLPRAIGLLSQLQTLRVTGCKNLEKLPTSIRKLHSLRIFELEDCGSIEEMGALTTLQGLPIWGSTSITELPASLRGIVSTLTVYSNSSSFYEFEYDASCYDTLQVLEEDKSGFLKASQHKESGKIALLRGVH